MAGVWIVAETERGITIRYKDWETRKGWDCGFLTPDMKQDAWPWLLNEARRGDLIMWNGAAYLCAFRGAPAFANEVPIPN